MGKTTSGAFRRRAATVALAAMAAMAACTSASAASAADAATQSVNIAGVVKTATGKAASGYTVAVAGQAAATTTDYNGLFTLTADLADSAQLVVTWRVQNLKNQSATTIKSSLFQISGDLNLGTITFPATTTKRVVAVDADGTRLPKFTLTSDPANKENPDVWPAIGTPLFDAATIASVETQFTKDNSDTTGLSGYSEATVSMPIANPDPDPDSPSPSGLPVTTVRFTHPRTGEVHQTNTREATVTTQEYDTVPTHTVTFNDVHVDVPQMGRPEGASGTKWVGYGWTPPSDRDGPILEYTVRRETGGIIATVAASKTGVLVLNTAPYPGSNYRVCARNEFGNGCSELRSVTTLWGGAEPGPPSTAEKPMVGDEGGGSVIIAVNGCESGGFDVSATYYIYRAPYSSSPTGSFSLHEKRTVSPNWETISGLTLGYYYKFAAECTNALGTSYLGPSSDAVLIADPPAVPAAPTVVSVGPNKATLTWPVPESNGAPIESYKILSQPSLGFLPSTTNTVTVTRMATGTKYTFSIVARNEKGASDPGPWSAPVAAAGPPEAPGNPTVLRGDGRLTVNWTAPKDNALPIQSYTIIAAPTGTSSGPTVMVTAGTTSAVLTGLLNGVQYVVTVRATNSAGDGPASSAVYSTPATVPGAPAAATAIPGDGRVDVTWDAPGNNGDGITNYTVTAWPGGITKTVPGWDRTATSFTGLGNGVAYTFTVQASNSVGPGPASPASSPAVPAAAPPSPSPPSPSPPSPSPPPTVPAGNDTGSAAASAPSNTAVPARRPGKVERPTATAGSGTARLRWKAPADGGSRITKYRILGSNGLSKVVPGTLRTLTIRGLRKRTKLSFRVQAINGVGAGDLSRASVRVRIR